MEKRKLKISGIGCALVDYLYTPVNFSSETFRRYLSVQSGDGGLSPGKLVFRDEFERFSGEDYLKVRELITNGKPPVTTNIGGPSIVSLIHAAQLLEGLPVEVCFYGSKGQDDAAAFIDSKLKQTPLKIGLYKTSSQNTPFSDVFSDPEYDQGHGERIFINNIGAAWDFYPEELDENFFESDIVVFGATALVPHIHEALSELLRKSKEKGAVTIVNTVYDFLNEKSKPEAPWPLGSSSETYRYIDLLITDREEALRLSGKTTIQEAMSFFKAMGTGAVIVTHGAKPTSFFCNSRLFGTSEGSRPVSEKIRTTILQHPEQAGDTTGCGDNFAGGVIASVASQMVNPPNNPLDMEEAIAWGTVSGGYACFYHGGTFHETCPGQKRELIEPFYKEYLIQIKTDN